MKKNILICMLLLVVMGGVVGQNANSSGRFEWVRGYAPGNLVSIIGSVTDSVGNLYILGNFNFASRWENGELLLPITPYNDAHDVYNTLIAKISPEGEMVWKKVIHGNYFNSQPHDIKAVGDSAFACLVTMPLTMNYYFYLYYLDTLVEPNWNPWPDYPISAEGVESRCLALITFDFDGNVLEQHFLQMSYLDCDGEDIYVVNPPGSGYDNFLSTQVLEDPSFDIDSKGNIYLCRTVNDYTYGGAYTGDYRLIDGDISAVKFWCDRRMVGIVPADSTLVTSPQILKFAPHFDTLLESRHVFQSQTAIVGAHSHIQVDRNDEVYLIGRLEGYESNYMVVDSVQNIFINKLSENPNKGYLVKFDSTLTVRYAISLDDSIVPSNKWNSINWFHDIAFDYDSNRIFLCVSNVRGTFDDTTSFYSILTYRGIPLERLKDDEFVISFSIDSAKMLSYGAVPSIYNSQCLPKTSGEHDVVKCHNNRVFVQTRAVGGLRYPDRTIAWPRWNDYGLGLVVFDYNGKVIGGDSYSAISPNNEPGPIMIKDSILYLMNRLSTGATFGDIEVPSRGDYFACIAKYVDTAFMTPYVPPAPQGGGEGTSRVEPSACALYPNPTVGEVTVQTDERIVQVSAYSMNGVRSDLKTDGNHVDVSALRQGVYLIEVVTEKTRYFTKFIKQ